VTVIVLGARDLERQRLGWRWAFTLDVVALGVPGAADKRAELAAPADERPLAALRTDLARALLGRRLVAGEWPGLLVLGIHRARQEPSVPSQADDHRMALGAHL